MPIQERDLAADAAFWNDLADKYAQEPLEHPEAFERKVAITRSLIKPTDVVLDIGCGTGTLALRLAPCAAHVHGLDLSSEMLRIAKTKAAEQRIQNVTFHVAPFDGTVPFAPGSVDVLCAYGLLHLLEDRPAALANVRRLLKPGGSFVSSTLCLAESRAPYRPLLWATRKLGKTPHVKIFSKQTLLQEIERAGFVDVRTPDVGEQAEVVFVVATTPA